MVESLKEQLSLPVRRALFGVVIAISFLLIVVPAGQWPWDHDEVDSLVELGLVPLTQYPGPVSQMARMGRLVPVFYGLQHAALWLLPPDEWGTRLVPAVCGALVAVLAFFVGYRTRGLWLAASLFVLVAGSQMLVWLSQQNRFYSIALLFASLELVLLWAPSSRWRFDVLAVCFGVLAVLTHGLTLVVFGLTFVCAVITWMAGWTPFTVVRRSFWVAAATGTVYLVYLRPILQGWVNGNTGGTSPLVSFVAQAGIAPLALAGVGCFVRPAAAHVRFRAWCAASFIGGLIFVAATPWIFANWNPRYGLFFMPALWMMAALGSETIARALPSTGLRAAWLAALVLMLAPKLASHFVDGSRHDFRSAAVIVAGQHSTQVLSNWPAELQYYLEPITGQKARYWGPGEPLPDGDSVIVIGSNAWEPVLRAPTRSIYVVGEVGKRRFDEQSHLIRIYAVSASHS